MSSPFTLLATSTKSDARLGVVHTPHGDIHSPYFMPIATKGAVKSISTTDLEATGASVVLSNTYHLMLRPGEEVLMKMGGLHGLMDWKKPILTDSGGYQVLSLAGMRTVDDAGVIFRSHIDGSSHALTPERSQEVQEAIGSDIAMILDDLVDFPVTQSRVAMSVERTCRWAEQQVTWFRSHASPGRQIWGIVQGSTDAQYRKQSAEGMVTLDFDGYAHGGLSVGEERAVTYDLVAQTHDILPKDRVRYFMGAGKPEEIVEYVRRGVDAFDCVLPSRNARHGSLWIWNHPDITKPDFFSVYHATNEQHRLDASPVDPTCACELCARYSRAYLRHLFHVQEPLAHRLATIHNVTFYIQLMERIRFAIAGGLL